MEVVDFRKALCLLIEDGVITYEQAKQAVDKVKLTTTEDKYNTQSWKDARTLLEEMNKRISENKRKPSRVNLTSIGCIEKLLRLDKRSYDEVLSMIEWSQSHDFWHSVILSPEKLRKHFDTMLAQRERDEKKQADTTPVSVPYGYVLTEFDEEEYQQRRAESVAKPKTIDLKAALKGNK